MVILANNLRVVFIFSKSVVPHTPEPFRAGASHTMFETENRGQVGIGTLIVFIAMVLVAAIAAGVLINTAGLLQAQAQQTGQETTAEVSDVVQVGKVVGYEYADKFNDTSLQGNGEIEAVNATVRLSAGSDPVNLSQASYTIATNGNASVVNGNNDANGGAITFHNIQGFDRSDSDTERVLEDQNDIMVVNFDLTNISGVNPIEEQTKLTFVAQAPAGGQSYKQLKSPRNIDSDESYIL